MLNHDDFRDLKIIINNSLLFNSPDDDDEDGEAETEANQDDWAWHDSGEHVMGRQAAAGRHLSAQSISGSYQLPSKYLQAIIVIAENIIEHCLLFWFFWRGSFPCHIFTLFQDHCTHCTSMSGDAGGEASLLSQSQPRSGTWERGSLGYTTPPAKTTMHTQRRDE